MTPKSAHLLRSHHLAGISTFPALATASGPRAVLAAAGAGRPGPHQTTGALVLAPSFPLTLTAHARDTGTPSSPHPAPDRSGPWLRNAAAGLCVLAAAAAAVSFTAQYRTAETARHLPAIAALEAAIPDAAALVFACLGIALAIVLIVAAFAAWAFLPGRYLPGNRARHLRIRLHLRLHPGKGYGSFWSAHRVASW